MNVGEGRNMSLQGSPKCGKRWGEGTKWKGNTNSDSWSGKCEKKYRKPVPDIYCT